jgi:hypothetical protein
MMTITPVTPGASDYHLTSPVDYTRYLSDLEAGDVFVPSATSLQPTDPKQPGLVKKLFRLAVVGAGLYLAYKTAKNLLALVKSTLLDQLQAAAA